MHSGVATAKLCIQAGITHLTLVDRQGVLREEDPTLNPYQRALLRQVIKTISRKQRFSHRCRQSGCFFRLIRSGCANAALIKSMNKTQLSLL